MPHAIDMPSAKPAKSGIYPWSTLVERTSRARLDIHHQRLDMKLSSTVNRLARVLLI